jgi:hypothetical protein
LHEGKGDIKKQDSVRVKELTKPEGKIKKCYVRIRAYTSSESNGEIIKVYGKWTTISRKTE